jgi:RNA polymerase sigma-70 factor (ECF subfamily)
LLANYNDLVKVLTRRLGSAERAEDALQDTYVRLERDGELGALQSPRGYLVRMALNIATDRWRAENRHLAANDASAGRATDPWQTENRRLTVREGDAILDIVDEAPSPEHVMAGRSDLRVLEKILAELPSRRRAIFEAAWIEERSHQEIAHQFGLALRTVQQELKLAREYCLVRFGAMR